MTMQLGRLTVLLPGILSITAPDSLPEAKGWQFRIAIHSEEEDDFAADRPNTVTAVRKRRSICLANCCSTTRSRPNFGGAEAALQQD